MNRDMLYLKSMIAACDNAERFLADKTLDEFLSDELLSSAVIRQIEVIGEAATQLSEETRKSNPNIVWRDIISMRNRLIHDYLHVDLELTYETAMQDLPTLKLNLTAIIENLK